MERKVICQNQEKVKRNKTSFLVVWEMMNQRKHFQIRNKELLFVILNGKEKRKASVQIVSVT